MKLSIFIFLILSSFTFAKERELEAKNLALKILDETILELLTTNSSNLTAEQVAGITANFEKMKTNLQSMKLQKAKGSDAKVTIAFVDGYQGWIFLGKVFPKLPLQARAAVLLHELGHTIGFRECEADSLAYHAVKSSVSSGGMVPLTYYPLCQQTQDVMSRLCGDPVVLNIEGTDLKLGRIKDWVGGSEICTKKIAPNF